MCGAGLKLEVGTWHFGWMKAQFGIGLWRGSTDTQHTTQGLGLVRACKDSALDSIECEAHDTTTRHISCRGADEP